MGVAKKVPTLLAHHPCHARHGPGPERGVILGQPISPPGPDRPA